MVYLAVIIVSVCALAFVGYNFFRLKKMEEGNDEMKEIAEIIRRGARTFMREEYKRIVPALLIVVVLIYLFIAKNCGRTFIL